MHPRLLNSALKKQEALYLYNFKTDERYELDAESFDFLRHCTGKNSLHDILRKTGADKREAQELVSYLGSEGCLENRRDESARGAYDIQSAILPSLRYLQLHITERCNLNCTHCYLGEKQKRDLDIGLIKKALDEFSPNGLKVLITGGEPLLHKRFWEVLELAKTYPVRLDLLSNGTLITKKVAESLQGYIHRVQISLDGVKKGHDMLRGKGCFEKTLNGIKNACKALDVSIATMVHRGNVSEFMDMEKLVNSLGAREWNIDIPSIAGNAKTDIIPSNEDAAEIFKSYGYGMGVHEGDSEYSCGSHICTIDIDGGVSKCGFFEEPVGNINDENLIDLWKKVVDRYTPRINTLKCSSCSAVDACRGGCRYRAKIDGDFLGKDPFMCALHLGAEQ